MSEPNGYTRKKGVSGNAGREGRNEAEEHGAPDRPPGDTERFPKIYTARDVARILKLDIGTVYRKLRAGSLPEPLSFSQSLRWNGWHFDRWIDDGCPTPERAGEAKNRASSEKPKRRRPAAGKTPKGRSGDGNG